MTKSVFSQVKGFCTQQQNAPVRALSLVLAASEHMVEHRDWDALAYFLGHAPSSMSKKARAIVGVILQDVAFDMSSKVAKAHKCKCTFEMGEDFGFTDKVEVLRGLVRDGESINSKDVAEALGLPTGGTAYDHGKAVKSIAKRIVTEGDNIDTFIADLRAEVLRLRAEASSLVIAA